MNVNAYLTYACARATQVPATCHECLRRERRCLRRTLRESSGERRVADGVGGSSSTTETKG